MEGSLDKHHEDNIAGKGMNSLSRYSLVRKFIPMLQAMKIPHAKAAVDKEWEKLKKIPEWQLTKVRNKNEVIDEARASGATVRQKSTFCIVNGSLSSQEFGVGATISKIQRSSRTPRWHCER